jgi:hypothetical protein
MLSVVYAECRQTHYAERRYAECRGAAFSAGEDFHDIATLQCCVVAVIVMQCCISQCC